MIPDPAPRNGRPAGESSSDGIRFGAEAMRWIDQNPGENLGYWSGFLEDWPNTFAPNLRTKPGLIVSNGTGWPLTVNDRIDGAAYPCSLHAQYVAYPLAELALVPSPIQRAGAGLGLRLLDAILRLGKVDQTVQWSSWLLSTNLHPPGLSFSVEPVTARLKAAFPKHAILVKNIHGFEDAQLPDRFIRSGYDLITSRQIYFFDGRSRDFLAKSTVKRDAKAFAQLPDYRVVEHAGFTPNDVPRIAALYRMLYLEKHSQLNPQYTERFVTLALRERWLEFRGLRHVSGRLDGVFACFSNGGTTSTPFIGYDTGMSSENGLYRHLVTMLLKRVAERGQLLNYSSGAGDFKRRRGGQPVIESNAVYTRHLSPARRAAFAILRELANRIGRRFLQKNEI